MENNGWIKLYRKSLKSSVWKNPQIWWVWSWCLMKANHKTHTFPFAEKDFEVKKGQFITGTKKACKELKLTPQKYRSILIYLINSSRIVKKSTNKFTLISIVNWDKYQSLDYKNNKRATNEQQTSNKRATTYKNELRMKKNEKEEESSSSSKIPKLTNTNSLKKGKALLRERLSFPSSNIAARPAHARNKKPFYDNRPMRQSQGKWWVIPANGGQWLEFAGSGNDIEWR